MTHSFEHLGPPPYRVVGVEVRRGPIQLGNGLMVGAPGQPMGTCQHCGMGIAEVWSVRASNGHVFEVGCVCVGKASKPLQQEGERIARLVRLADKHARDDKRISEATAALSCCTTSKPKLAAALAAKPHPMKYRADRGETLLDYVLFMLHHAGRSGGIKAARIVEQHTDEEVAR